MPENDVIVDGDNDDFVNVKEPRSIEPTPPTLPMKEDTT